MVKVDYIIVGFGLAGLAFAEQLEVGNKSYIVFENGSQRSSRVAGGLYNPVILKRFTLAWNASEQLEYAISHYKQVEQRIQKSISSELPILRRFNSIEEQNLWFEAADKPNLKEFLSPTVDKYYNPSLDAPYHYGRVRHTGRIHIDMALSCYLERLENQNVLIKECFDYNKLQLSEHEVCYEDITSNHIVFAEGFGLQQNPFFTDLPLVGNKGEYLIIKSKDLKLSVAVKSSIFIIPLGEDLYKVGATYNNQDKSPEISVSAREEILRKLNTFLKGDYEVVDQVAGIRPTTKDRRPLIGTHQKHKNLHIINGLGSRGIIISPWVARDLYDHIEHKKALDEEIDIKRFIKS